MVMVMRLLCPVFDWFQIQTHYSFTCSCVACKLDLPRSENLPDRVKERYIPLILICPTRCKENDQLKISLKKIWNIVLRYLCLHLRWRELCAQDAGVQWLVLGTSGSVKTAQAQENTHRLVVQEQEDKTQFHHFVWFHQLGAEVAEVMARIVAVSRKEVARLSNCWSQEYFTDLETCHVGGVRRLQQFSDWVGRLLDRAAQSCETTFQRARRPRTGELQ